MEEKYILFNPFFNLHIFPEGGFIFREVSKNVQFLEGEKLLPKGTSIINKKAAEFFYLSLSPKKEICNECENFSYCAFCFSRAISKYKEKKDCVWAKSQNVEEIFNLE